MQSPSGLVARHAQRAVEEALADTRVVVILGARQVGKSTLLEQIAGVEGSGREILTLDDQAVRLAAQDDPAGFVAALRTPVAIDEVQRVPELMTEIKLRVDRDTDARAVRDHRFGQPVGDEAGQGEPGR